MLGEIRARYAFKRGREGCRSWVRYHPRGPTKWRAVFAPAVAYVLIYKGLTRFLGINHKNSIIK